MSGKEFWQEMQICHLLSPVFLLIFFFFQNKNIDKTDYLHIFIYHIKQQYSPVQLCPSPSIPTGHPHTKLPCVFVQIALGLHSSVSHSLISVEELRILFINKKTNKQTNKQKTNKQNQYWECKIEYPRYLISHLVL